MKKPRRWIPLILGILILAGCLGVAGYRSYQSRFAYVGEVRYEKTVETLDLSEKSVNDLTQLQAFPGLKRIDLRGTGLTCGQYDTLRSWFPEAEILWDIPFQGEAYDMETDSLAISALTGEDAGVLSYFPCLKSIDATQCRDYAMLLNLMEQYPGLEVRYGIWLGEERYDPDTAELILTDADIEQLRQGIPYLPKLKSVRFEGTLPEAETLTALAEANPEIEFYWQVTVLGTVADVYTTELDFSGMPITSTEELEAAVEYLPALEKVLMMDCGLSNEEMDALNKRHEGVLFVWNVVLNRLITVRSDAKVFAPVLLGLRVWDRDLVNLKYCTELEVIDLGHMPISNCDFLENMPNLKYLILVETNIKDISPVANLKNLKFLEIFLSPITDYTPLLECTALEDLNLSYTRGDPEVLMQMTWLKRLWYFWGSMTNEQYERLKAALPDTQVERITFSSTDNGWRKGYLYYEMRDLMGLPYLE